MATENRLETKVAPKAVKKKPAPPKQQRTSMKEYFSGIKTEMKKVIWPTRKELTSYTVVVIATCAFFALAFWGINSGVLAMLKGILGITM